VKELFARRETRRAIRRLTGTDAEFNELTFKFQVAELLASVRYHDRPTSQGSDAEAAMLRPALMLLL